MFNLIKLSLLSTLFLFSTTSNANEYSQDTIDFYMSSCRIGDLFTQDTCECAIQYIQENLTEKEYNAAILAVVSGEEVKPETLEILTNALSAECESK